MNELEAFWNRFLDKAGRASNTTYFEAFHFCLTEELANELLELVLIGKKRATASSYEAYRLEGCEPPKIGDLSIVTDWNGTPRCVIETTATMILPFNEMTFDICQREGEDECLETWKDGHARFFSEEGNEVGYKFTEDMMVLFEDFQVIYQE